MPVQGERQEKSESRRKGSEQATAPEEPLGSVGQEVNGGGRRDEEANG